MSNFFSFNGLSCHSAGVILKEPLGSMIPAQRGEDLIVPGRDGRLWSPENAADNMDKTLQIWVLPTADLEHVRNWLRGEGRLKIEDGSSYSYDARISGHFEYQLLPNGSGWVANVPVTLAPYATLDAESVINVASGDMITSPSPVRTYVRLILHGSGDAVIRMGTVPGGGAVGKIVWREIMITGFSDGAIIDGVSREAYHGSTLINDSMDGDWPYIDPGKTTITYSGDLSSLEIGAQWAKL